MIILLSHIEHLQFIILQVDPELKVFKLRSNISLIVLTLTELLFSILFGIFITNKPYKR